MEIRFIRDADILECNEFHNRTYGLKRTLGQWHWQFSGLLGGQRPFVVAVEEGRIVGTQALMPIAFVGPAGTIATAKSEETLVDPLMRGRGVFQLMYEPLFELARAHGIQSIWGFTPAFKPFKAVGFVVPGSTGQLVLPLSSRAASAFGAELGQGARRAVLKLGITAASWLSWAKFTLNRRRDAEITVAVLDAPPDGAGRLCKDFVRGYGGVTIFRDAAYLGLALLSESVRESNRGRCVQRGSSLGLAGLCNR